MGKRSRKQTRSPPPAVRRPEDVAGAGRPAAHVPPPDRRSRKLEAPRAPWAPLPLTELAILAGIVLVGTGFALGAGRAGPLLVAGFALISIAALELAGREHRAGYRSHSTLLSAAVAIVVVIPFFFLTRVPYEVLLVLAAATFAATFKALRTHFARRSQGLGFRA